MIIGCVSKGISADDVMCSLITAYKVGGREALENFSKIKKFNNLKDVTNERFYKTLGDFDVDSHIKKIREL